MYLYIPMGGRSIAVKEYIISSTGMQSDEPIMCLEEVLGKLLKRLEEPMPKVEEPVPETMPEAMPESEVSSVVIEK